MPVWKQLAVDPGCSARAGVLRTQSGIELPTPLFQPVATAGSLKTLDWADLDKLGYRHVLMNTYHLAVRPGSSQVAAAGGVHKFTGWGGSILTDSGGYQVHSLAHRRSVRPEGVHFTDHIDGGRWLFSPGFVLEAQAAFGVDFAMCIDVCTGLPASRSRVARDLALTHAWAVEQSRLWPELSGGRGALLGIVQGGLHEDLRAESIELISSLDFDGVAVGGLAVGEEREDLQRMAEFCGARLPDKQVHYLMGIGEPADLLQAIACGFDMFDCVQPTRMARHGQTYTRLGRLPLRQARFTGDDRPLDERCRCSTCRRHSRAYLRHLFTLKEHSYARLLTIHNLAFYRDLLARARRRIIAGNYGKWWPKQYESSGQLLPDGA